MSRQFQYTRLNEYICVCKRHHYQCHWLSSRWHLWSLLFTVCCLTFARLSLYCIVLLTVRHLYSFFVVFVAILATLTTAFSIVFIYLRITENMRLMWVKKFSHFNGNFAFNCVQLKLLHNSKINGIKLNYTLAWHHSWWLLTTRC